MGGPPVLTFQRCRSGYCVYRQCVLEGCGCKIQYPQPPSPDTGCRTSLTMHYTTVQKPLITVSPNSNPTIVILQEEAGFVCKHKMSFYSIIHVHRSLHHWRRKRLWFPVKSK
ncbi:hypothetical protein TNCV_3968701 [Trichonephila clavipes]|nr:hypothetical protein TNCV_3968701 [Trichonephila clavipes]